MKLPLKNIAVVVCILCNYSLYAQPDIIYYNGHVITMNPVGNVQGAIAINGDEITAVGSDTNVLALKGKETVIINLDGRTLMPGFVDAHAHLLQLAAINGHSLEDVQANYLMNGITTLGEPTVEEDVLKILQEFSDSGKLIMNLNLYLRYNNNCNDPGDEWFLDYPATSNLDASFRIAGVKIFTDGGTCGTIAALTFEYPAGGFGDLFLSEEILDNMLTVVDNNGYQALLHAQGDAAVNMSLDGLEKIIGASGNPLRHRIDHNSFINPENMSRYGEIGITPVIFGYMNTCSESNDQQYTDYFGEEHISWLENWRLMHDENPSLPIGWHSDAPSLRLDPISHMASYVTRMEVDEDNTLCKPPQWLEAHALTIEEAMQIMTIGSAYTLNRESMVGSLEVGKQADFVFLSENPLTVPSEELFDLQILGTMAKGIMRYCLEGNEDLCSDMVVTGIQKERMEHVVFSPNPTNGIHGVVMKLDTPSQTEITVFNIAGKIVFHQPSTWVNEQLALDWNNTEESNGVYLIHAIINDKLITKKIILDH